MRVSLLAVAAIMASSATADDRVLDPVMTLNLHLTVPDYAACSLFDDDDNPTCEGLEDSSPEPGLAFLWVIASRVGGFPGGLNNVAVGIDHAGMDIAGWTFCTPGAGFITEDWPDPGSGVVATWALQNCDPSSENAKVMFFTVEDGASGSMQLIGHPDLGAAAYDGCATVQFEMCQGNLAGANLAEGTETLCGDNCNGTPTQDVTWTRVKEQYR